MTEAEKTMKRYMHAIERRLELPREVRVRVMRDLQSTVAQRREAGQTDAEIYAEMGSPKAVAAELNEQMAQYAYGKSKWRWAALTAAVIAGVMLVFESVIGLLTWLLNAAANDHSAIGIIGGADGPTAIFVTSGGSNWMMWLLVLAMALIAWWKLGHLRKE